MRIFILRHAIAEDTAKGGDSQRALSEEGRKKMKDAAAGFAELDLKIDAIYSSPLVRAVQTAEILAKAISYGGKIETMQELSPGNSPEAVCERVRSLKKPENIVLSGHEPNCSDLAGYLLNGAQIEFKKGAICLIETESVTADSGTVLWHLSPQILRLMKR